MRRSCFRVISGLKLTLDFQIYAKISKFGTGKVDKSAGQKVVVVVAREADWEASPRQATLVYAGTEKSLDATWWGKKVK